MRRREGKTRKLLAVSGNAPDANGFIETPTDPRERQRVDRNANDHTHTPPETIDAPEISGASMVIVGEFRSTLAFRSLRWHSGPLLTEHSLHSVTEPTRHPERGRAAHPERCHSATCTTTVVAPVTKLTPSEWVERSPLPGKGDGERAKPGSTDWSRSERHQAGAPVRRCTRRATGFTLSVIGDAGVPAWGRVAAGNRWIQAKHPRVWLPLAMMRK
ncbi:hypothetical protein SAMN05428934_10119 [Tessaracoccus flavus]|nr:hypothetical protein SAMN05428934_10119 [Tessaracoccus flavus]